MRYDHSYAAEHYNAKTPEMVDRVVECFAAALDWMWQQGYQPMIVPMNTVEPDDDRVMGRLVMRAAEFGDHALLIDQAIHPCVVPGILRHCQFGLTSRLHASVLATVANCPMAIYAIGPKLHGIAETMGTQDWTIDEEQATPGDVVELLRSMVTNIESIRALLAQRLVELRNQALTPAHVARDIVTGRTSGLD